MPLASIALLIGPVASDTGERLILSYDGGWLSGQSNPRGEHNPYMTLVANVTMRCY
jgi:hypothetical protein